MRGGENTGADGTARLSSSRITTRILETGKKTESLVKTKTRATEGWENACPREILTKSTVGGSGYKQQSDEGVRNCNSKQSNNREHQGKLSNLESLEYTT